ncbi:MAG: GNAT family N-acetyltransferase [Burkholderiales bacterium]|nr:GNAT family N-acetyltransferase [Burkholderiales bacterium]
MIDVQPVTLARGPIRLVPLGLEHEAGLAAAAADGELWQLRITSVPEPGQTRAYIEAALAMRQAGNRLAFAVLDADTGQVIGSSSYHDIVPALDRLEIGYTWYAKSRQRSAVNTTAKWLLMQHAFETLGAQLVGWRTDNFNFASQQAIERLGARRDGVLRHHAPRRDGSVRDTVMYSMSAGEWPEAKRQLEYLLNKPR